MSRRFGYNKYAMFLECAENYLFSIGESEVMEDIYDYFDSPKGKAEIRQTLTPEETCDFALEKAEQLSRGIDSMTRYNDLEDESTDDDESTGYEEIRGRSFGWNALTYFMKCVDEELENHGLSNIDKNKIRDEIIESYLDRQDSKDIIISFKNRQKICKFAKFIATTQVQMRLL